MADYCSNKVDFSGDNGQLALEHFSQMGYDAPPYYAILVDGDALYFESRWIPPLRDLIGVAESFDLDFKLTYQLPNERAKEKYSYVCLINQKLPKAGEELRKEILACSSLSELEKLETALHERADQSILDSHQRSTLTQLLGKKTAEILGTGYGQQSDVQRETRSRGR